MTERKVFFRLSGHLVHGRHLEKEKKHILFVAVFLLYVYTYIFTCIAFIQIIISAYQVKNYQLSLRTRKVVICCIKRATVY